jgi:general secretion pathway protein D
MRFIAILLLALIGSPLTYAHDVNISTVTQNGITVFYLQAGAFSLEKDAQLRQTEIQAQIKQPVEIKDLLDKHLHLVQVGPINDYQTARALKAQLSNNENKWTQTPQTNTQPLLEVSQMATPHAKTAQNPKATLPDETKLWNLRNADVRAVITEVSRVTGKNFIIDPRVQGKISMISTTPIPNNQLYQVFLSVLQVSGYAAIPNGNVVKIIPNIEAKTQSSDMLSEMRNSPKGDDMMVAVVPVHYVPAEQLVPVLRPLMPQWSNVSAYAPSNMLILSGRANNIKSLAHIIKQVDSSSSSDIDIIPLQYALAMDVANTLKDLVKTQTNTGRTQLSITADDRSNAILVSGGKTDRIRLSMLILKLDKTSSQGINSNTQVVYLNYLRAEDLVPILAGIAQANFSGTVGTTVGKITRPALDSTNPSSNIAGSSGTDDPQNPSSSTNATNSGMNNAEALENTTSATTQNEGSTKPTVQIIAEPNTNSIILNAPVSLIRILKNVINQLDIKPAQLLIEALVAEIDQSDVNTLGLEWGTNKQTGKPSDFRPGFAIINSKTKIDDFQAQIYALARARKANILSTPSVVVLDNRQAKILVGKQVSIASTSYPNNAGGTTTASPYTTFNRVNVALHLYVRPQITRAQGIQMQIDQGNDTLDPTDTLETSTNPTFKISSIVTSVHVESGDIVVLGGLTQDSIGNDNNRLPIIGDIPGLGRLFQRNIRNRDKRVLMVFIKPIILRNERENLQVTGDKYNDVRQYQLDWLRSQEVFEQTNNETVMDPLTQASLPRPFVTPPPAAKALTTK